MQEHDDEEAPPAWCCKPRRVRSRVGRRVFAENASYAQEALSSIETVGRAALDELNRLLRALHTDEDDQAAHPFAPTVSHLPDLVERIRATGRPVELRTDVPALPASTARAVYRIVQEALTNAVKHTATGLIRVTVDHDGASLRLEVTNECTPLDNGAAGHGLVNMRERARLEGGYLDAGPFEGGFRVRATLPIAPPATP